MSQPQSILSTVEHYLNKLATPNDYTCFPKRKRALAKSLMGRSSKFDLKYKFEYLWTQALYAVEEAQDTTNIKYPRKYHARL